MADTLISGIFVTGIYGYGIFGKKITGMRDTKTPPPNGASFICRSNFPPKEKHLNSLINILQFQARNQQDSSEKFGDVHYRGDHNVFIFNRGISVGSLSGDEPLVTESSRRVYGSFLHEAAEASSFDFLR